MPKFTKAQFSNLLSTNLLSWTLWAIILYVWTTNWDLTIGIFNSIKKNLFFIDFFFPFLAVYYHSLSLNLPYIGFLFSFNILSLNQALAQTIGNLTTTTTTKSLVPNNNQDIQEKITLGVKAPLITLTLLCIVLSFNILSLNQILTNNLKLNNNNKKCSPK